MLIVVTLQFFWFALISANASAKCLETAADFQAQSKELPKPFDHLPLLLSIDSYFGKAALQVRVDGEKLKLVSFVSKPGGLYTSENDIENVCFDGPNIHVILKNKGEHTVVLNGEKVSVDKNNFSKCSEADFQRIATYVKQKIIETQKQTESSGSSEGSM
jgi:hypothetical protein